MGCGSSIPEYTLTLRSAALEKAVSSLVLAPAATETEFRSAADFTMRDIIGKGGKSVGVQVAFHHASQQYYAIKFINEARAAAEQWEVQPLDEMRTMRDVTAARLPFVTPLRGFFEERGVLAIVMSYMPGGELFSRMAGRRLVHDEALFYGAELVLALEGLHRLGYMYRDLKPENVLLDDQGHAHLCDLGFAIKAPVAYRRLGCVGSPTRRRDAHLPGRGHGRTLAASRGVLRRVWRACTSTTRRARITVPTSHPRTRRLAPAYIRVCSTPQYQAPEIISKDVGTKGYTNAVDWWALGVLLVRSTRLLLHVGAAVAARGRRHGASLGSTPAQRTRAPVPASSTPPLPSPHPLRSTKCCAAAPCLAAPRGPPRTRCCGRSQRTSRGRASCTGRRPSPGTRATSWRR